MSDFIEKSEQEQLFRQKQNSNVNAIFLTNGSAGNNNTELARILTAFDFTMNLLGWQNKPLANLTNFLTQYQASLDTKYHNDFKEVLIAEEVERKRAERKGLSIL